MLLSICFPVFDDFDGLYFSALNIILMHAEVLDHIEIVVVDNNPTSPQGKTTKEWVENHLAQNCTVRYVYGAGPGGPAATKQKCVDVALGKYVLVMDSHVLVAKGSIARLLAWYENHPGETILASGPLIFDRHTSRVGKEENLGTGGWASHLDEVWRGEDLGIWATDPRAGCLYGTPFDIPAMGCGLFTCPRESFVGFNPAFRGFGAEEFYLYRKSRLAGHKTLCLPFLRWVHRFARPGGTPYILDRWCKIRNYILGHQELGYPLDGIHKTFVETPPFYMSEKQWSVLSSDPIRNISERMK